MWSIQIHTDLFQCAWCLYDADEGNKRDHKNRWECQSPTNPLSPAGVVVLIVLKGLLVQQSKHHHALNIRNISDLSYVFCLISYLSVSYLYLYTDSLFAWIKKVCKQKLFILPRTIWNIFYETLMGHWNPKWRRVDLSPGPYVTNNQWTFLSIRTV